MSNVVNLFDALPPRVIDKRIDALYRKFGHRPFTTAQGADCVGMNPADFWSTFFYRDQHDDRFRVCSTTGGFYLSRVPPTTAALPHWKMRYLPLMRKRLSGDLFSIQQMADAINVPYASAAFLAGQFVAAGLMTSFDEKFRLPPRRKVIMNAPRPKVRWGDQPIYIGY